jgi:sugar/nucleoside kinase (ribokinase family)
MLRRCLAVSIFALYGRPLSVYNPLDLTGKRRLLAVGRVMVDFWSRTEISSFDSGEWLSDIQEIKVDVGGPAHVCAGFLSSGYWDVLLVSAIGAQQADGRLVADEVGSLALRRLDQERVLHSCVLVRGKQTGRVMILYPPHGGRLMVSDIVTAPSVPGSHVETAISAAVGEGAACIVYVDGYTFFDKGSADVPLALARRPRGSVVLWVDVLPHHLYQRMSFDEFLEQIQDVDLVTMERSTLLGFTSQQAEHPTSAMSAIVSDNRALAVIDDGIVSIHSSTGKDVLEYPAADRVAMDRTPGRHDRLLGSLLSGWLRRARNFRTLANRICVRNALGQVSDG